MLPKGLGDLKKLVSKEKDTSSQIEEYKKLLEKNPKNIDVQLKLGDAYAKTGDKEAAIKAYTEAAIRYAEEGHLVKAIAVNKIIVRLDPSRKEAHERLANLYFQRGVRAEPLEDTGFPEKAISRSGQSPQTEVSKEGGFSYPLEKISLLSHIDPSDLTFLKKMATLREFNTNQVIPPEGEKRASLFIILEGKVKTSVKNKEGASVALEPLGPGDFFGELSLLAQTSRQTTMIAETPCKVLEISEAILKPLLIKFPKTRMVLEEVYNSRELKLTLALVPLFSDLKPEERLSIAKHLTLETFPQGAIIFKEGTPGDSLYIVKSGRVGIYTTLMEDDEVSVIKKAAKDQKELYLSTLEKGDFFGESALLTREPRSATATAIADNTELLKLSQTALADIVKQYPRIRFVMEKYHQWRVRKTLESLKSIL
ncbi:MAG TPA: cyclic nucleotide-binding domain-containing protein [Candidatus Limnocylindrales bacterium]|nr:cyclic nucleotide-binding domain-containing protein [Candidatus Limnocylindrales bacterium]